MIMERTKRLKTSFATTALGTMALVNMTGTTHLDAAQAGAERQPGSMRLRIDAGGATVMAMLEDSPTARDFAALLPLTVTLVDYAGTEKVSDLPRRLSTAGAPAGFDPSIGDIAYYGPWGNLAIFYRDFQYSSGLIKLGTINGGMAALDQPGPMRVTIALAGE
jgi:hypothetical protein